MRTIRRAHRRRFGRHARFNSAVMLTIVLVAWVAVPSVVRFVSAWAGYAPVRYEPRDRERQSWLEHQNPVTLLGRLDWNDVIGIALFLLVAVVWLTLMPGRSTRRTPLQ